MLDESKNDVLCAAVLCHTAHHMQTKTRNQSKNKKAAGSNLLKASFVPAETIRNIRNGDLGFHPVPELCYVLKCCAEFIGNNYFF